MIEPLTAEIRHFNIDDASGNGEWLTTSYQLDNDLNIDLIQSWRESDNTPFPLRLINLVDLAVAIEQKKRFGV